MWLLHPGFKNLVADWWSSFEVKCPPGQRFCLKLKLLRDRLRWWNREVFRNVERRKDSILNEINLLDAKEEIEGLLEEKRSLHISLKGDFEITLLMEEVMWR